MACLLSLTAVDESSLPTTEVHLNMYGGSTDGMSHWSKCLVLLIKKKKIPSHKKFRFYSFWYRPRCTDLALIFFPEQPSYLLWDGLKYLSTYKIKFDITVEPRVRVTSLLQLLCLALTKHPYIFWYENPGNAADHVLQRHPQSSVHRYSRSISSMGISISTRSVLDRHPDRYSVDTIDQQSVHGRPSVYRLIWINEKLVVSRPTVDPDVYRSATRPQMPLVPMIQCGHQRPHSEIPTYIIFYNFTPFIRPLILAMIILPLLILWILIQVSIFKNSTWIPDAIKKPSCLEVQLW